MQADLFAALLFSIDSFRMEYVLVMRYSECNTLVPPCSVRSAPEVSSRLSTDVS